MIYRKYAFTFGYIILTALISYGLFLQGEQMDLQKDALKAQAKLTRGEVRESRRESRTQSRVIIRYIKCIVLVAQEAEGDITAKQLDRCGRKGLRLQKKASERPSRVSNPAPQMPTPGPTTSPGGSQGPYRPNPRPSPTKPGGGPKPSPSPSPTPKPSICVADLCVEDPRP